MNFAEVREFLHEISKLLHSEAYSTVCRMQNTENRAHFISKTAYKREIALWKKNAKDYDFELPFEIAHQDF